MARSGNGVEVRDTSIFPAFTDQRGMACRETIYQGHEPLAPTPPNVRYAHRVAGAKLQAPNKHNLLEQIMNDVTRDLLEALKAAQAYVCGPTAWTQEQEDALVEAVSKAIARAEAALADAKNDSYRLDAIEAAAKASGTGVSFDWCRHVEDGIVVEHGYRMMWKHAIGPREKSVRHAIDAAMEVFKP